MNIDAFGLFLEILQARNIQEFIPRSVKIVRPSVVFDLLCSQKILEVRKEACSTKLTAPHSLELKLRLAKAYLEHLPRIAEKVPDIGNGFINAERIQLIHWQLR